MKSIQYHVLNRRHLGIVHDHIKGGEWAVTPKMMKTTTTTKMRK
jgi:hypothetical protein